MKPVITATELENRRSMWIQDTGSGSAVQPTGIHITEMNPYLGMRNDFTKPNIKLLVTSKRKKIGNSIIFLAI